MQRVMSFAARLIQYRKSQNLSLAQLSEKTGFPAQTLNRYELGRRVPKIDTAINLAQALGVDAQWLQGYDVPMEPAAKGEVDFAAIEGITPLGELPRQRLPLVGTIACGEPLLAQEEAEGYVDVYGTHRGDFCIRARGDSMINARIYDGDLVVIRKQPVVENGEIAAVLIEDEATLKRVYFYPDEDRLVLLAENPLFPARVFMNADLDRVRILGKAVEFISAVR